MKRTGFLASATAILLALSLMACGEADVMTTAGSDSVSAGQTTAAPETTHTHPSSTTGPAPVVPDTTAPVGTTTPATTPVTTDQTGECVSCGTSVTAEGPGATTAPDTPTTTITPVTTDTPTTSVTPTTTVTTVTDPVTPPSPDPTATPDGKLNIVAGGKSNYTVIYPSGAISATRDVYTGLQTKIRNAIGYSFTLKKDSDVKAGEYEILIGRTNRPASAEAYAKLGENQFSFTISGKSVVIAAWDDACMKLAIETFAEDYAVSGSLVVNINDFPTTYDCGERYNTVTIDNTENVGGDDPYVVKHDGYYYYCWSENGVKVARIDNLNKITKTNGKQVFNAGQNGFYQVWAPELHYIDGEWYIYVAMCKGVDDNAAHRMYCLKGTSQDPTDPFKLVGQVTDSTDRWAIDGTVFQYQGELYTIWSGWQGATDSGQYLYIAHMSNPWTIDSERVQISDFPSGFLASGWDKPLFSSTKVHEGPCVLVVGDTIHVLFSANGSWTDDYCIGTLTFSGGDILKASSWKKSSSALLSKSRQNYGPGHCSVVQGDDGSYYMLYHGNLVSGSGWNGRSVRVQQITITEQSITLVGGPLSADLKISEKYVIGRVNG